MDKSFHRENRHTMYNSLTEDSLVIVFSGSAPRKTNDEYYPFFAQRNFVYLTGIEQQQSILMGWNSGGEYNECLFLLSPDMLVERWNGRRLKPQEAEELSAISDIRGAENFRRDVDMLLQSGKTRHVYLDFEKFSPEEPDNEAYRFAAYVRERYPFIGVQDIRPQLRKQRTIKKPCEIAAMRRAEEITRDGIIAMMQASRPGMYEYQYKADFDYALAQRGVINPGFPPIISAGDNNFCIHYYAYRGQARDGDMVLNDVGACFDNQICDVSRGWPCNGRFSDRQRLLYECAYATSEHMFGLLRPGLPMAEVDATIRKYNYERLKEAGVCRDYSEIGTYMWHGGAHHIGYDVHDVVDISQPLSAGMMFCVDVGIYHEEWGIGFRLEDNCLITETGCENLSAAIPRTIEEIEAVMGR